MLLFKHTVVFHVMCFVNTCIFDAKREESTDIDKYVHYKALRFHIICVLYSAVPPSPPYLIVKQCTTIHQCIIGRDRGTLTCATSGVRPLISVKWSTDENSGVRFSSAKSTSHDKMGLFDVLTEVEYVIEDYIECGARLQVTCHAFGQAAAIFQSTVNITIVKGKQYYNVDLATDIQVDMLKVLLSYLHKNEFNLCYTSPPSPLPPVKCPEPTIVIQVI